MPWLAKARRHRHCRHKGGGSDREDSSLRPPVRFLAQKLLDFQLVIEAVEVEDVDSGTETPRLGLDHEPGKRWRGLLAAAQSPAQGLVDHFLDGLAAAPRLLAQLLCD